MAKKYENPHTTLTTTTTRTDGDSDEDCEVYFLKPVNEYNITERIKEANKELFANNSIELEACEESALEITNRKVTFALNLEDYEPSGENDTSSDGSTTIELAAETSELHAKLTRDFKFPAIEEEDGDKEDNERASGLGAVGHADELVEEICEEIIIMDMEEQTTRRIASDATASQAQQQRRQIVKQNTFVAFEEDCVSQTAEEEIEEITELPVDTAKAAAAEHEVDSDNKSLNNLLTSDCAEGNDTASLQQNNNVNINQIIQQNVDSNNDDDDDNDVGDDDDDDDDKLSIIVASYISDDYGCDDDDYDDDTKTLHRNDDTSNQNSPTAGGVRGGGKVAVKSRRILPFGKRFSLRRKVNNSSNAIGASGANRRQQQQPPLPEITDLKLNYKTCCEYRNAVHEKLPKYTGYLSEYGLSAAQISQRTERMQRKKRNLLEQTLKANEQEMQKMHDNERAFTTWLRNKIRFFPINKTRNMFDVKRSKKKAATNGVFGCNGKAGSSGCNSSSLNGCTVGDSGGKRKK